jgi:hypothetical protein
MTRFDLEQQIMDCWGVVDDIKTLYRQTDIRQLSEDEWLNCLLGFSTVYQFKFEQLFDTFEKLIAKGDIK